MKLRVTRSTGSIAFVVAAALAVWVPSWSPAVAQSGAAAQSGAQWKPLFNGKDLTGWTVAAGRGGRGDAAPAATPTGWVIDNGVLVGGRGPRVGALASNERYKDFELELDFLLDEHGTRCSAALGEKEENMSEDRSCLFNSGISFRTGYQVNIGRREAGEYVGVVVHRKAPGAIRGNVLWLSTGDEKFANLRKKGDWNTLRITAKGPHITVALNGTKISDFHDDPTDPAEAQWKEAAPITIQWPYSVDPAFEGTVKFRNIRVREI